MSTSGNGQEKLKIGTKNGCLTIIGGFEEFDRLQEEKTEKAIIEYTRQIEEFKSTGSIAPRRSENGGVLFSGFAMRDDPVAELEKSIEKARHWREDIYYRPRYKVQCKCGDIHYVDQFHFEKKRHRFCDSIFDDRKHYGPDTCGLRAEQHEKQRQSAKQIKGRYYDTLLPFSVHESLDILGFGEDKEIEVNHRNKLTIRIERPYRCKCYLCGKEWAFPYEDFQIRNDEYGIYATDGYYSKAHCDCHQISSFQWRTIDILRRHNVSYRVEISFDDLRGAWGRNLLRYDFGLFSPNDELLMLLECQGEQHFKPVDEFGGRQQFKQQEKNDDLKRQYAVSHGIQLIEIPYTCNTYSKEKAFLQQHGVI